MTQPRLAAAVALLLLASACGRIGPPVRAPRARAAEASPAAAAPATGEDAAGDEDEEREEKR